MNTIQITIDESLLKLIDKHCRNRSAFFREAAQLLIKNIRNKQMEKRHEEGYKKYPVKPGEFDVLKNSGITC